MNPALFDSSFHTFKAAPRYWRSNMCGVRIEGIPAVPGGGFSNDLILSWFYDRYVPNSRRIIRSSWKDKNYTHILLSWPDSQDYGFSPIAFKKTCIELIDTGFFPCVMLSAKPNSSSNIRTVEETLANINLALNELIGTVPMFCVGWELSLWLSPSDVQFLIDSIYKKVQPSLLYVHFQEGYFSYQQPGQETADFWKANVNKLTGVLHQRNLKDMPDDKGNYQARIVDCIQRFSGDFNFPNDSGFGHPFDFVALEITAQLQFNGYMSEAEGDDWGDTAIEVSGVMGSGNGMSK